MCELNSLFPPAKLEAYFVKWENNHHISWMCWISLFFENNDIQLFPIIVKREIPCWIMSHEDNWNFDWWVRNNSGLHDENFFIRWRGIPNFIINPFTRWTNFSNHIRRIFDFFMENSQFIYAVIAMENIHSVLNESRMKCIIFHSLSHDYWECITPIFPREKIFSWSCSFFVLS